MDRPWTEVLQAIASVGTLIVTAAGLFAVYIQIRKLQSAVWGETHGKLCDQSLELLKMLAEKPSTRPYFAESKELSADEPEHAFVLYAAEAIANFMEHLVLQRDNLPQNQWDRWNDFIDGQLEESPVIQEFLLRNRQWYSTALMAHVDELKKRLAEGKAEHS
jgi:hypothetical protein